MLTSKDEMLSITRDCLLCASVNVEASHNAKKRARQLKGQGESKCQEACPSMCDSERAKASQNAKKRARQYACQLKGQGESMPRSVPDNT